MITHSFKSWFKTFDLKQKTQKAQKDGKLVFKRIRKNTDLHESNDQRRIMRKVPVFFTPLNVNVRKLESSDKRLKCTWQFT